MSSLRRFSLCSLLLLFSFACFAQEAKPSLAEPSFSPDGSEIVFTSGGDIWTVAASGGIARLLVANPATESRPLYSPDGQRLAFVSTRTGNGDIYVLDLTSGDLHRVTYDDASEQLDAWSNDGKWLYFSSTSHDISGMNDIYRVAASGGTPMPVTSERYTNEFHAAPAPNGKTLVFCARGIGNAQWWRNGHSHLDESEIWQMDVDSAMPHYERLVAGGAKQLWPMWTPNGRTLYFMSDRSGHENIWAMDLKGTPRQITHFDSGRVLWPSISRDGKRIVFERDFGIWVLDLADDSAAPVKVELRGLAAGSSVEHRKMTDQFRESALSPDGKKIVFSVLGDIFAVSAKDGGEAVRVTNTPAREAQLTWAPDSSRIAYISDRDGADHVYLYDFRADHETQLTRGTHEEVSPVFSPDGKMLAFKRDRKELVVLDLASGKEKVVATGVLQAAYPTMGPDRSLVWSPDSRWIAYSSYGDRMFHNVSVVPVDGGGPRQVSFIADVFSGTVDWSPDGKFLLMDTSQRTEDGQIARIDLLPRVPRFQEDRFRDLFKESKAAPKTSKPEDNIQGKQASPVDDAKPEDKAEPAASPEDRKGPKARKTEVVFDGIRQRFSLLPLGLDASSPVISPDGKWLAFTAEAAGQPNIYVYSLDELAKERPVAKQLTATRGQKSSLNFTPDSKQIYYLDRGQIDVVSLDTPKPRHLAVSAELDVNSASERSETFAEGWRWLRDNFFDAHMNGVNWDQARTEYAPHIAGARTDDEMRRIMSLMIGELNSSHSGIMPPRQERRTETGRLGLRFDRFEYEKSGKLQIASVVPMSPGAIAGMKAGEYVEAIDGTKLDRNTDLDSLLRYQIGHKTEVTLAEANGAGTRTVSVKPVDQAAEKSLLYRDWVEANREYVNRISQGKLGYVHMIDMSEASLRQLFLDLDSDNQHRLGVVIDIRNNNGGFVNAYALDVLARRGYLTMTQRGLSPVPARAVLGQRALELPTILVTNQHSLSDAEDFTEGYRALGLGKVVGEPTAGWIIYTINVPLIDGSMLRIPFTRITDHEGHDMEMHPRSVDIAVQRPLGEGERGVDSQLDAAVTELLHEVDNQKPRAATAR